MKLTIKLIFQVCVYVAALNGCGQGEQQPPLGDASVHGDQAYFGGDFDGDTDSQSGGDAFGPIGDDDVAQGDDFVLLPGDKDDEEGDVDQIDGDHAGSTWGDDEPIDGDEDGAGGDQSHSGGGDENPQGGDSSMAFPTYCTEVRPILVNNCTMCHSSTLSGTARNGAPVGVNFDSYQATVANHVRANMRIQAGTMPPSGSLTDADKTTFGDWILGGLLEGTCK